MGRYVARRLLQMIPVFFGTTVLIHWMVWKLPGDPIRALTGDREVSAQFYAQMRDRYHLDEPWLIQYWEYIKGLFQGDLGTDFYGRPVADIMSDAWPVTVKLAVLGFAIEIVIGLLAGILAALRKGSFFDNIVLASTTLVVSIPIFVLGYTMQVVLGVQLGWFEISYSEESGLRGLLLPALVLASINLAYLARMTRTSLVENLRADYVRTAVAKGLSRRRVVGRHALRNSLIPVVTLLGVDLGVFMGGAIVTENVFNIPGIGNAVVRAIESQDGTVVVGIVTAIVLIFLLANLLVDVMYGLLDPRIRYE